MKVSVSYLNVSKKYIENTIKSLDTTSMDYLHVDVMDGKYVSGKANLYSSVENISRYTRKRLDIHFMVEKPLKLIDDYALLDVFCMTFHLDIKNNLDEVIDKCHSYGIKVGLAINPSDDIDSIFPYLDKIDLVLVMSVVPGKPGQQFMKEVVPKIKSLRDKFKKERRDILISVDGGINNETKAFLSQADILVSGSYITNSDDLNKAIESLR